MLAQALTSHYPEQQGVEQSFESPSDSEPLLVELRFGVAV
jgi:hypothetical protein